MSQIEISKRASLHVVRFRDLEIRILNLFRISIFKFRIFKGKLDHFVNFVLTKKTWAAQPEGCTPNHNDALVAARLPCELVLRPSIARATTLLSGYAPAGRKLTSYPGSNKVKFIMSHSESRPASFRASVGLLLLVGGIVSACLDDLLGHLTTPSSNVSAHSENGSRYPDSHVVRDSAAKKSPECSICFFHKLLGHSLIPAAKSILPFTFSTTGFENVRSLLAFLTPGADFIRGPPSLS